MNIVDRCMLRLENSPVMRAVRGSVRDLPRPLRGWFELQKTRINIRRSRPLVPVRELEEKYFEAVSLLQRRLGPAGVGDYLEFGVCSGSSVACMDRALKRAGLAGPRLIGFDSFEGLPDTGDHEDGGTWYAGQFRCDLEFTQGMLQKSGVDMSRVILVKGWFSDTLNDDLIRKHSITKASVIIVDSDLYSSAREALDFCVPLVADQAVLFFDDWNLQGLADRNLGERRAFEEFRAHHPQFEVEDFPAYSPVSKAFIVTRKG